MLEIYTVSFFGHRQIEDVFSLERQTESLIRKLLFEREYVAFLVGRNGEFDQLVSSLINRVKREYRADNSCHTLVLPYETGQYRNNAESFHSYYDEVIITEQACHTHFKKAITLRNRDMIDRSDLAVFYLTRKHGGAYQTYQYAARLNKNILLLPANLAEDRTWPSR